jgi:hypothetical protein
VLLNQVNLRLSCLKPQPGEVESGAVHTLHAEQIDIERGAPLEVADDERDMIDPFDGNGGATHEVPWFLEIRTSKIV